jgi:C-terminal processing protease CtpA/Prc
MVLRIAVVNDDLSYNYRFIAYRRLSEIAEFPISINCRSNGGNAVALNYVEETSQTLPATPAALSVQTLENGIEYVRIARFPEDVTQDDSTYVASLAQRVMPMIIDLRGFDGGADPLKSMLTDALFTPDQQLKEGTSTQKMSILTFAGYRGYYVGEVELAEVRPLQPGETREMAIAAAQEKLDSFDQGIQANIGEFPPLQEFVADTSDMIASGTRTLPFKNPIVILADRKCASQCEFFVSAMRHHPMVTVIGLPTAGLLQFASNVKFYLPNSAVQMVSSTKFTEFLPAALKGEGIKPSYMIANSDWIKTALQGR